MVDSGMVWTFASMAMAAVLMVIIIWPATAIYRAKAALSREEQYRTLAERAVAAQENAERRLGEVKEELAIVHAQLASLNRVLTEVQ